MPIIISHTAIVNPHQEMLLLHRSPKDKVLPGFWDLPGGAVKLKEDPVIGAIREAKEECGLRITNLQLFASHTNWDKVKKEQFITLIFYTKNYQGKVKLDLRDHNEYAWVKKTDIKKFKVVPNLEKAIKIYAAKNLILEYLV